MKTNCSDKDVYLFKNIFINVDYKFLCRDCFVNKTR